MDVCMHMCVCMLVCHVSAYVWGVCVCARMPVCLLLTFYRPLSLWLSLFFRSPLVGLLRFLKWVSGNEYKGEYCMGIRHQCAILWQCDTCLFILFVSVPQLHPVLGERVVCATISLQLESCHICLRMQCYLPLQQLRSDLGDLNREICCVMTHTMTPHSPYRHTHHTGRHTHTRMHAHTHTTHAHTRTCMRLHTHTHTSSVS